MILSAPMNRETRPRLRTAIFGSLWLLAASPAAAAPLRVLQFKTTGQNVFNSAITLDHPKLNGKPELNLIVTHNYGVEATGHINNAPIGVSYDITTQKWVIFNETPVFITVTPTNTFNVLIAPLATRVLATARNVGSSSTFFPVAKNKPNAKLLVTHLSNPFPTKAPGLRVPHYFDLRYFTSIGVELKPRNAWGIVNVDASPPLPTAYNVLDVSTDANCLIQTVTAENMNGAATLIDHPVSNGNPNAVVFASAVFNPGGGNGTFFGRACGVLYTQNKWSIYCEDLEPMPVGSKFNVLIFAGSTP